MLQWFSDGGIFLTTTVYIDVLFFENFMMDYLALYLTAFVMNIKPRILKLALSSGIGAFYMCSLYFSDFMLIKNVVFKIIVFCAMIFISFPVKRLSSFFRYIMAFLFINISLGGCIYFFGSIFLSGDMKNGVFYVRANLMSLILGVVLLIFIGRFFVVLFKKNMTFGKNKKELIIFYKNKKMKLNTLLDTGNTLVDPISHKSVVVVSEDKIKKLVNEDNIFKIKNFRLIPCRTVTDKYELLYGFKPDRFIYKDKEIDAVVAISKSEFDGDYDAVINPVTLI